MVLWYRNFVFDRGDFTAVHRQSWRRLYGCIKGRTLNGKWSGEETGRLIFLFFILTFYNTTLLMDLSKSVLSAVYAQVQVEHEPLSGGPLGVLLVVWGGGVRGLQFESLLPTTLNHFGNRCLSIPSLPTDKLKVHASWSRLSRTGSSPRHPRLFLGGINCAINKGSSTKIPELLEQTNSSGFWRGRGNL